jgi:hypothetical protein
VTPHVGVDVSKKSAVSVAENLFNVEEGSSAFKRGATGLLETLIPTNRASHARQVKGDDPDKKRLPWPSRLGVGRVANNPTP